MLALHRDAVKCRSPLLLLIFEQNSNSLPWNRVLVLSSVFLAGSVAIISKLTVFLQNGIKSKFSLNRSMWWGSKLLPHLCFDPLKKKQVVSVTTVFLFLSRCITSQLWNKYPFNLHCQFDRAGHFVKAHSQNGNMFLFHSFCYLEYQNGTCSTLAFLSIFKFFPKLTKTSQARNVRTLPLHFSGC